MRSVFPGVVLFEDKPEGWLEELREVRKVRWVARKRGGVRKKPKPPPMTPEMALKVALLPESMRKEFGLE